MSKEKEGSIKSALCFDEKTRKTALGEKRQSEGRSPRPFQEKKEEVSDTSREAGKGGKTALT